MSFWAAFAGLIAAGLGGTLTWNLSTRSLTAQRVAFPIRTSGGRLSG